MEDILKQILSKLDTMERYTKEGFQEVNSKLDEINTRVSKIEYMIERLENNQPEDIKGMLEVVSKQLETVSTKEDIEYLARKLGEHELELDRLKRTR